MLIRGVVVAGASIQERRRKALEGLSLPALSGRANRADECPSTLKCRDSWDGGFVGSIPSGSTINPRETLINLRTSGWFLNL